MIEFPEEVQEWDSRVFELLMKAIPPARESAFLGSAGLTRETIQSTIDGLRDVKVPTWVVPPGLHVDPAIPVNVVESPLVGPGYFVHIPVDAFDPLPGLDW